MTLQSNDDLREIYRQPGRFPVDKVIARLDEHCVDFLSKSPMFILASSSADGICDASPKGGPLGFVEPLDEHRLAWGDYAGNNRLDSFQNIVENASVGLLFLIPGLDETLRVNGTAELSTDPDLCTRFSVNAKPARVVVVVTVVEAYVHCAKALRRSEVWSPETWLESADIPSAARMIRDHASIDVDIETIEKAREEDLKTSLWEPGGES